MSHGTEPKGMKQAEPTESNDSVPHISPGDTVKIVDIGLRSGNGYTRGRDIGLYYRVYDIHTTYPCGWYNCSLIHIDSARGMIPIKFAKVRLVKLVKPEQKEETDGNVDKTAQ